MMSMTRKFGLVVGIFVLVLLAGCAREAELMEEDRSEATDLVISNVRVTPWYRDTFKSGEEIYVDFDYEFSRPESLAVWMTCCPGMNSYYEGADPLEAGSGTVTRYVSQGRVGKIEFLRFSAQDPDQNRVYRGLFEVDLDIVPDPDNPVALDDGTGSTISDVRFEPPSPARLQAGGQIKVHLRYDINTEHGLSIFAVPEASCCITYEGSQPEYESGAAVRHITAGAGARITAIKITLKNTRGTDVHERSFPVDYAVQ